MFVCVGCQVCVFWILFLGVLGFGGSCLGVYVVLYGVVSLLAFWLSGCVSLRALGGLYGCLFVYR